MPGKRGEVQGWSSQATRSNIRFLRSVTLSGLTGGGLAFTHTLRDCPPTHDEWARLRRAYIKRLERAGAIRIHWVTEWQRRGVPHLHGCVFFPDEKISCPAGIAQGRQFMINSWCSAAWEFTAARHAQHVNPVDNALGWFQYVAKHAARGQGHYQRSKESIPPGWKKTGRMWGHIGDWPTREAIKLQLDNPGFFAFRRIVQRWRYADARAAGDQRRIITARRMLQCSDKNLSSIRGVSEWVPEDMALLIVHSLSARGYAIEC